MTAVAAADAVPAAPLPMPAGAWSFLPPPVLAWAESEDDRRRFLRIRKRMLLAVLAAALLLAWLPPREVPRPVAQASGERSARLLIEPPRAAEPPPEAVPDAPRAPAPQAPQEPPPQARAPQAAAPVVQARRPQPDRAPGEATDARTRASGVGLLALKDELAALRSAPAAVQLNPVPPGAGVGAGSGPGVGAGSDAGVPARALVTSRETGGSGGLNTAALSRDTGGGGLPGHAAGLVEGAAGGRGDGGAGATAEGAGAAGRAREGGRGAERDPRKDARRAVRSIEEIRLVFERNKGAIYALYQRALREEPTLHGRVVLELKIAPAGQVTDLRLVSSELRSPELETRLLARIKQFDFGARQVEPITLTWPVDFLPS